MGGVALGGRALGRGAWEVRWADRSKYDYYGSIVHEVTAEVDEGKILSLSEKVVDGTEQEPFNILKATSLDAWLDFFKQQDIIKV